MYTMNFEPDWNKPQFYEALLSQVTNLTHGQRNWVTNLANVSSLIFNGMNSVNVFKEKVINWVGFYVTDKKNSSVLLLGPFQGNVACSLIQYGKGVCGVAASKRQTQIVENVHAFPGHIACDSESNSEIVIPISSENGEVLFGVLDIDSQTKGTFDDEDKIGLEKVSKVLANCCDW